jgi:PPK2 family polyphosphate:nucleotide phosphotransferase
MVQGQFLPPNGDSTGSSADYRLKLEQTRSLLKPLQKKLYAGKQFSVLMIFQALDAAGKDGAIREVFEGLDVGGIRVASFKQPSRLELAHDFLWRTNKELPERGVITAFNRSYYEEVLTVRVHPEFLNAQYAGNSPDPDTLWPARFRAIRELENHLAMSNTLVLKFWLDVSPQRQAMRFLDRLEDEKRRWKFSENDIVESGFRSSYDEAVKQMLGETSSPFAPWFCIPADNRWYLRWQIADVLLQALQALPLRYPDAESMNAEKHNSLSKMLRARAAEPFS